MASANVCSASCPWSLQWRRRSSWASVWKAASGKAESPPCKKVATTQLVRGTGMSLLEIKNLHVKVDNHEILKGIDLKVNAGEVHSIMGPNGSGKSTLAQVLARRETYAVTTGEVSYNGKDLLAMKPEEAACEGIFMAFQYPVEIPGISNAYFLRSALNAIHNYRGLDDMDAMDFMPPRR